MVNINVRISDEQERRIRSSGLKISDYTREALNFYNIRKGSSLLQYKIDTIQECIDLLDNHKKELQKQLVNEAYRSLYENEENVKKSEEESVYKTEETVKKIYGDEENSLQNVKTSGTESVYKNNGNVKTMWDDPKITRMEQYLPTLSKLLHIQNTIPDTMRTKIKEETLLTPSEINEFIVKYKEEIKSVDYDISPEHVKCEPGEKKYKEWFYKNVKFVKSGKRL